MASSAFNGARQTAAVLACALVGVGLGACRSEPASREEVAPAPLTTSTVVGEADAAAEDASAAADGADAAVVAADASAALPQTPPAKTVIYGEAAGRLPLLAWATLSPDGKALAGVERSRSTERPSNGVELAGKLAMMRPLGAAVERHRLPPGAARILWLPGDDEAPEGPAREERFAILYMDRVELRRARDLELVRSAAEQLYDEIVGFGHDARGRRLVVCDRQALRVIDARFGERTLFKAAEGRSPWESCAIDGGGRWVAAVNNLAELHAFDLSTGERRRKLKLMELPDDDAGASVRTLVFNAAGDGLLATVFPEYEDMHTVVVGVPAFRRLGARVRPSVFAEAAVHPAFDAMVAVDGEGALRWVGTEDKPTPDAPAPLGFLDGPGHALPLPDGTGFVVAAGRAGIWSTVDRTARLLSDEVVSRIVELVRRDDGAISALDRRGDVLLLEQANGRASQRTLAERLTVRAPKVMARGGRSLIALGGESKRLVCTEIGDDGKTLAELAPIAERRAFGAVALGPRRAAFGLMGGVAICDMEAGEARVMRFQVKGTQANDLAFDPSRPDEVVVVGDARLQVLDLRDGATIAAPSLCPEGGVDGAAIAAGGILAGRCQDHHLYVTVRGAPGAPVAPDAPAARRVADLGDGRARLSLSSDGRLVAALSAGGGRVLRLADGAELMRFETYFDADVALFEEDLITYQGPDGRVVTTPVAATN